MAPIRILESQVWLPVSRAEVFGFFADARNLEDLTPPWLNFRILTPGEIEMKEGARIDYRIRLRGLPLRWRTLITAWEPPLRFVDEQIRGPYRLWRHEHRFMEQDGGTLCTDRVEYRVALDALVHARMVRPELERIFAYRRGRMIGRFGGPAVQGSGREAIAAQAGGPVGGCAGRADPGAAAAL
ncbi:MAG: SRPBCC family protein [Phycisphaerales bacterium]|nr:SRPBCC family protein [Phycisphaerales bacterium]